MAKYNTKIFIDTPEGKKTLKELSEMSGIGINTIYFRWYDSDKTADYEFLTRKEQKGKGGRKPKRLIKAKPLNLWKPTEVKA